MSENTIEYKVAQQTEESAGQTRRAFIKGSAAVAAGVMFTKAAEAGYDPKASGKAYAGQAEITEELPRPHERNQLGYGVRLYPYGMPSKYEAHVQRRTLDWLTPDTYASITLCPLHQLHGIITPNGLHFERYHGGAPEIDPKDHKLVIHGLVDRPLMFTVDDIKRFPSVQRIHFIECPANGAMEWKGVQLDSVQWTHGMMSCSEWTGVPLSVLLKEAGADLTAKYVIAEGSDASGMSRSIPMEICLDDCIVAYAQNGEALRNEQGYPIRLIPPGCEGNMWVKHLRRLYVTNEPLQHREETSKYTELYGDGTAAQFTWVCEANSVITYPSPDFRMEGPGRYVAKGLAWSGRGKVSHVDITLDGGRTWNEAKITSPVLDKAWVRFEYEFDWDGKELFMMSRATDNKGYTQPNPPMLRKSRGTNAVYHRNGMVTWRVHAWNTDRAGEIQNVQY
jgi:sulfane dehydrogenase subunit SoxC